MYKRKIIKSPIGRQVLGESQLCQSLLLPLLFQSGILNVLDNLLLLILRVFVPVTNIVVPLLDALGHPVAVFDLAVGRVFVSRVAARPVGRVEVMLDKGVSSVVIARVGVSLSGAESLDGEDEDAAHELGFVHVVEVVPGDPGSLGLAVHLLKNGSGESRWSSAADDLVKVKLHLAQRHTLVSSYALEPLHDVFNQTHHDGLFRACRKCPLAERHGLLPQDGVVFEIGLVNLNADNQVNVFFVVSLGNKPMKRLHGFDINVCVNAALSIHDHISQKVGFDDR